MLRRIAGRMANRVSTSFSRVCRAAFALVGISYEIVEGIDIGEGPSPLILRN